MPREPFKIKDLLEDFGAIEPRIDTVHQYELRRGLLCSRYFELYAKYQERWDRAIFFTAPLFVGSMLIVVFVFAGTVFNESSSSVLSVAEIQSPSSVIAAPIIAQEVKKEPNVYFFEPTTISELHEIENFTSVQTANYILAQ